MEVKRKAEVIMLSTEKANKCLMLRKDNFLTATGNEYYNYTPQHLYILSSEEIKEGDWIYHPLDGKIVLCSKVEFETLQGCSDKTKYGYKKIIATTDEFLGCSNNSISHLFPQPSPQFIAKFIESYNKGEVIKEVIVEYEDINLSGIKVRIKEIYKWKNMN